MMYYEQRKHTNKNKYVIINGCIGRSATDTRIKSDSCRYLYPSASALTQSTTQNTVCSGNTCTTRTCVNGICKTTNSGSSGGNFALNICMNGACTSITKR